MPSEVWGGIASEEELSGMDSSVRPSTSADEKSLSGCLRQYGVRMGNAEASHRSSNDDPLIKTAQTRPGQTSQASIDMRPRMEEPPRAVSPP